MRTVSAPSLSKIVQSKGGEPINVLEIFWTDTPRYYSDREVESTPLEGKIVELANLENVVNISGNSASQSISLVIDDTDGSIKQIYNNTDIHKKRVNVYQWFDGLNFNDKFLIFQGEINSPIIWKEGDQTLSFEVVSQLEDKEVGFSPEEGSFDVIPDNLIGQAWPLPFGTCLRIPGIQLDSIPTLGGGRILDSNGVEDYTIPMQQGEIYRKGRELLGLATMAFYHANAAYYSGYKPGGLVDDYWRNIGDQWLARGNQFLEEIHRLELDLQELGRQFILQKGYSKSSLRVSNGECFPQGGTVHLKLNGVDHEGTFSGNNFAISKVTHPKKGTGTVVSTPITTSNTIRGQDIIEKAGFIWVPAGQTIHPTGNLPIRFIVAMLPCSVLAVWAYKNVEGSRILSTIPGSYYTSSIVSFGGISATVVTLVRPLSYYDEEWDDQIYVDLQSPIGPNTVSIITWLIQTYTSLGIDAASFAQTSAYLSPFPSNFCLFDRKNIVELLSDIAFQSRCAIWLNNGVFFLRYLPSEPAPLDTITETDTIHNSIELHHTSTEDIITKLVASYKTNYAQEKDYKIILRNNVTKYGTQEQNFDWFIYTDPNLVDLAATFWIIRKSNTWKLLQFKTPLHKLRLETFDPVTVNFVNNYASIGPITGIIESVNFDSENLLLDFSVWLPVRLGEMTKYGPSWPSVVTVYPTSIDSPGSGGPGEDASGDLTSDSENKTGICTTGFKTGGGIKFIVRKGKRRRMHDGSNEPGTATPVGEAIVVPTVDDLDDTEEPRFDYAYRKYDVPPLDIDSIFLPRTFPAKIVSEAPNENRNNADNERPQGKLYNVSMYAMGVGLPPIETTAYDVTATESSTDKLEAGTWIVVNLLTWSVTRNGTPTLVGRSANEEDSEETLTMKSSKLFVPSKSNPSIYPGVITAAPSVGTYTMNIYKTGLNGPTTSVPVKQLKISGSVKFKVGSWAMVGESKKPDGSIEYFTQMPVWS